MRYIEYRVYLKDDTDIEDTAEQIKDYIYDKEEGSPIRDVTYVVKESPEFEQKRVWKRREEDERRS